MKEIDLFFITKDEVYEEYCFTFENSPFVPSTGDYIDLFEFKDVVKLHFYDNREQIKENFNKVFLMQWVIGKKWWKADVINQKIIVFIDLHNVDNHLE